MLRFAPDAALTPEREVASDPLFIADPADARLIAAMDGLVALYHRPSGMTHILAPPAPQILEALEEGPARAADILRWIAARYAVEDEEGEGAILARLAELETAGLVRRA